MFCTIYVVTDTLTIKWKKSTIIFLSDSYYLQGDNCTHWVKSLSINKCSGSLLELIINLVIRGLRDS